MERRINPDCLHCRKPLHGREDKKFCNDSCRNNYNNNLNRDQNSIVRNITNALYRNRKILKHIQACENMEPFSIAEFLQKGFQFDYITHVKIKDRKTIYYCFEYSYHIINGTNIKIISSPEKK